MRRANRIIEIIASVNHMEKGPRMERKKARPSTTLARENAIGKMIAYRTFHSVMTIPPPSDSGWVNDGLRGNDPR